MPASAPILVTGGTGVLGRQVVDRLRAAGQPVRILSRSASGDPDAVVGDLASGAGIDSAVEGVETIVHCAGSQKGDGDKARTLVAAATRAGASHLVFISVVGADRVPVRSRMDRAAFGYFAEKADAERVVAGSGIPWTTLRATQFHDLAFLTVRALAKLPIVPVPTGSFQPVDSREVADRITELALGSPSGLVEDLAGPAVYPLHELVRSYLRAVGKRRILMPVRVAGGAARAIDAGANLAPGRAVGVHSWEEFLATHARER